MTAEEYAQIREAIDTALRLGAVGEGCLGDVDAQITALDSLESEEGNTELIQLKRQRNRMCLIHQLPTELLVQILLQSIDLFDWTFQEIKSIALVSTRWFDIVDTHPAFWPELCSHYPLNVVDIVLKRNIFGCLRIRAEMNYSRTTREIDTFMGTVAQYAHRWETVLFHGRITAKMEAHLSTPAPFLRDLVISGYSGTAHQGILKLGEGLPLRHLDVDRITVDWGMDRLSDLRTIQLRKLTQGLPSALQFHAILAASPKLEWLSLAYIEDLSSTDGPVDDDPTTTLHLPHLSTLSFDEIPTHLSQPLLSTIEAPACRGLIAHRIISDPSNTINLPFYHTLASACNTSGQARLTYDFDEGTLRMGLWETAPPEVEDQWIYYLEDPVGVEVTISFPQEEHLAKHAAAFLSKISSLVPAWVQVWEDVSGSIGQLWLEDEGIYRWLVVPWRSVVYLNIRPLDLLQHLAKPHSDGDENLEWLCPRLVELRIQKQMGVEAEEISVRVLDFANRRYGSAAYEAVDTFTKPVQLERLVVPAAVAVLLRDREIFRRVEVKPLDEQISNCDWPTS